MIEISFPDQKIIACEKRSSDWYGIQGNKS
jgi:hypothetical protein